MTKSVVKIYTSNDKCVDTVFSTSDNSAEEQEARIMITYDPLKDYCVTTQIAGTILNTGVLSNSHFTQPNLVNEILRQFKESGVDMEIDRQFMTDLSERLFISAGKIKRERTGLVSRHGISPKDWIVNTADSKWNKPLIEERKEDKMKVKFNIENIGIDNENQVAEWLITPEVNGEDQNEKSLVFKSSWVRTSENHKYEAHITNQLDDCQPFNRGDEILLGEFLSKSYDAEGFSLVEDSLDMANLNAILDNIINAHEIAERVVEFNKSVNPLPIVDDVSQEDVVDSTLYRRANYEVPEEISTAPFGEVRGNGNITPNPIIKESNYAECATSYIPYMGRVRFCIGDGQYNQLSVFINNLSGEELSRYTENNFVERNIVDNIVKVERIARQVSLFLSDEDVYTKLFFVLSILVGKYHDRMSTLSHRK